MRRRALLAVAMAGALAAAACAPPLPPSCSGDSRSPVNRLSGGC